MTKAIQKVEETQIDWNNQDQVEFIKKNVAPQATPQEFGLFVARCKMLGLNPLLPGEIHFVKYGNRPGTIIVGIEGFRKRAQRTGQLAGIKREVIRDDKGKCTGARVTIYRKDWTQPAIEEVSLAEYSTGANNWAKMPETMIKKVAEVSCLRMAFSDELGGLYAPEEMDQATPSSTATSLRQEVANGKPVPMTADEYMDLPEADKEEIHEGVKANGRRRYAEQKKQVSDDIPVIQADEAFNSQASAHMDAIANE